MVYKYDFLIIGSGVAGMSYALKVARAHKGKVCMIARPRSTRLTRHSHKVVWRQLPTWKWITSTSTYRIL